MSLFYKVLHYFKYSLWFIFPHSFEYSADCWEPHSRIQKNTRVPGHQASSMWKRDQGIMNKTHTMWQFSLYLASNFQIDSSKMTSNCENNISKEEYIEELRSRKLSGGSRCCIENCVHIQRLDNELGIQRKYHKFPLAKRNPQRLKMWLESIPQCKRGWTPQPSSRICSSHFEGGKGYSI